MGIRVVNETALSIGHGEILPRRFWARRGRKYKALLAAALIATPAAAQDLGAIARGASASAVLGAWCRAHHLPPLTARRERSAVKAADPAVRAALAVGPTAEVRYRRVTLACGARVMSRADNWYLPGALNADMNRRLEATDAPFGVVVAPLDFHRTTLRADHREVRAVLAGPDGTPFSYVVEAYRR